MYTKGDERNNENACDKKKSGEMEIKKPRPETVQKIENGQ
jgi:hypothetical protein